MINLNLLKKKSLQDLANKRRKNPKAKVLKKVKLLSKALLHLQKKVVQLEYLFNHLHQKSKKLNLNHLILQETELKKISKLVSQIQKNWEQKSELKRKRLLSNKQNNPELNI